MSVLIKGLKMPKECGECRWFYFNGMTCTTPRYYLDSRCKLMESGQDWYGKDERGGWVGKDISNLPGYGGYYPHRHCVEVGTRTDNCPLVEVSEPHGRLIDANKLIMHLADYQLQESPVWGSNGYGNADKCEAITDCIDAVESACSVIEAEGNDEVGL